MIIHLFDGFTKQMDFRENRHKTMQAKTVERLIRTELNLLYRVVSGKEMSRASDNYNKRYWQITEAME